MTIMLDISRLMSRQHFATPTGIDRFELSYARWLSDGRNPVFVETGAAGASVVPSKAAHALIDRLERQWAATAMSSAESLQLDSIVAAIEGRQPWQRCEVPLQAGARPAQMARRAAQTVRQWARSWVPLPADATYLHISHARLHRPASFAWLNARQPGSVFYVHDLIPLSHPEFCRAGEAERHMHRMRTVLKHADLVLCNSRMTAATLDQLAQQHGLPQPRSTVLPPGVNDAFLQAPNEPPLRTKQPYFVCIGTIEPRKNHALLLKLWRRLVERHGQAAPKLVIVGRRGWDNAELFKLLDHPGLFQGAVIEVADLADAPLTRLLAGAAGLLAPSFVEGYGMPVTEALATQTPVIASDIASHREIAGGIATLLDPLNGGDWLKAIEHHAAHHGSRRARAGRTAARLLWTWADHFQALERLMAADGKTSPHPRAAAAGLPTARGADWTALGPGGPRLGYAEGSRP